ncbi:hypothetical protein Mgra_00006468 [Meloidogyne graminicola]|uniref:Uncharacterized protein n=1 Tax=Meloidogyne graminicola TaxID=189291 RepID=A0A8S9ZLE0_9BILA|nr:hypothetical protein Mgra_00006468 [Meloidogyne graminicola]
MKNRLVPKRPSRDIKRPRKNQKKKYFLTKVSYSYTRIESTERYRVFFTILI